MKYINKIIWFFECLLMDKCIYSSKKLLAYGFSLLVIYLVIFTSKDYYELLIFITVLLGLRSYDTAKNKNGSTPTTNNDTNEERG